MAALIGISLHRVGPAIHKEQQIGGRTACKQRPVSMELVFGHTTAALREEKILYELYSAMGANDSQVYKCRRSIVVFFE
jgi:hypothetical protein